MTPTNIQPTAVFAGTPISIVAANFGLTSPVQYLQSPGATGWKKDGWSVWYGPSRPDAFLSNLFAVSGNKAYLLFSEQDFTWNVTGTVALETIQWKPNAFNLVGLGVNAQSPPSFGSYFSGSSAHQPCRVYRLINDQWVLVADPASTPMRSGEACWVYCTGGSDFQGPLGVNLTSGTGITFSENTEAPVIFLNKTVNPQSVTVEVSAQTGGALPLAYAVRSISVGDMTDKTFDLPATYALPALEAGQSSCLWLKLRKEKMTQDSQNALLKISSDVGAEIWLPVSADRSTSTTP